MYTLLDNSRETGLYGHYKLRLETATLIYVNISFNVSGYPVFIKTSDHERFSPERK